MSGIGEWERDVCLMSPLGGRLWGRRFASGDAAPEEGARRLSPDEACSVLSRLWARGEERAALAPLGGSSLFWVEPLGIDLGRCSRQVDALWEVIEQRLRAEQLTVWERDASPAAVRPRPAIAPRPQPLPGGVRPLRTFIEVRLEDEAGAEIADRGDGHGRGLRLEGRHRRPSTGRPRA